MHMKTAWVIGNVSRHCDLWAFNNGLCNDPSLSSLTGHVMGFGTKASATSPLKQGH